MAPAVEILFAEANEAYRQDPSLFNPVLDIVNASKGSLGIYHGIAIEDPSILLLVIPWDELEDHHALMNDKKQYAKLTDAASKCIDLNTINLFHVYFDTDLTAILNAPFTSFDHILTLKPGKTTEDLRGHLNASTSHVQMEGCHGGGYAKAVEKDEFVVLYGWDNPQFPQEQTQQGQAHLFSDQADEVIDQMKRGHVKLIAYKQYQPASEI